MFWVIFILAFVLRGVSIILTSPSPQFALTPDSMSYIIPAKALLEFGAFTSSASPPFIPETVRTPGYPFFLIPFFWEGAIKIIAVQWAQVVLGALTSALVYHVAMMLWNERKRAALIAGLVMAVDFVTIIHTSFILAETLFLFFWTMALCSLLKSIQKREPDFKWLIISGMILGLASLTRPIGLYYFILATPLIYFAWNESQRRIKIIGVAVFVAASLFFPSMWTIRNRVETGRATFSSIQDFNLYVTRSVILEMHMTGLDYNSALNEINKKFFTDNPDLSFPVEDHPGRAGKWATNYILSNFGQYLHLLSIDTIKLLAGNSIKVAAWLYLKDPYYDPASLPFHSPEGMKEQLKILTNRHPVLGGVVVLYLGYLGAIYIFSFLGLIHLWKTKGPGPALLIFSPAFYIIVVTIGAGAHARYRIPAMPSFAILAGSGILFLQEFFKSKRTS